jgi:uncharacterized protein
MRDSPSIIADDILLQISMLGAANRRLDLARNAETYYKIVTDQSCLQCVSEPRPKSQIPWLLMLAGLVLPLILIAIFHRELAQANTAIWATIFLSSMLSSVVGFAFSAIAGASLFHIDNSYIHAVQTMLVSSISLQSYSVLHLRKTINLGALLPFLAGGAATLALGAHIATHTKPALLLLVIGTFLVVYGTYTSMGPSLRLKSTNGGIFGDIFAGALGGITGPVAAFPGPFVTIWCSMKGWDKSRQRGIGQPYILIMQVITLATLSLMSGAQVAADWHLLQYILPAIAGAFFGLKLFERLDDKQFLSIISVFLVISGVAMLAKGL